MTVLVEIRAGTGDRPVYCFHPLGGSAAVYGPLAAYLADRPVWGLQSTGLTAGHEPDRTVPAMAARYAAAIGPVDGATLLGYSFGGVVALETARLLTDPLVVLVDADPLYTPLVDAAPWHILTRQVLGVDVPLEELAVLPRDDALERVRAAAAAQGRLPSRFNLERLARMFEVCRANERAAALHVPLPYAGPVRAFRSGPAAGGDMWHAFAADTTVHPVPVEHRDVLGPQALPHISAGLFSDRRAHSGRPGQRR